MSGEGAAKNFGEPACIAEHRSCRDVGIAHNDGFALGNWLYGPAGGACGEPIRQERNRFARHDRRRRIAHQPCIGFERSLLYRFERVEFLRERLWRTNCPGA